MLDSIRNEMDARALYAFRGYNLGLIIGLEAWGLGFRVYPKP